MHGTGETAVLFDGGVHVESVGVGGVPHATQPMMWSDDGSVWDWSLMPPTPGPDEIEAWKQWAKTFIATEGMVW